MCRFHAPFSLPAQEFGGRIVGRGLRHRSQGRGRCRSGRSCLAQLQRAHAAVLAKPRGGNMTTFDRFQRHGIQRGGRQDQAFRRPATP
jgi:hypothetical protein